MFDGMRPDSVAKRMQLMREAAGATLPKMMRLAPRTRFNNRVSGELGWAWRELSFTEVRQVKSVLGGTVNDLVLAVLSGGIGRYLRAKGDKTEGLELRAMCPVSMRQSNEHGQLGNLVSMMIAPLHAGIEDPLARHQAGIAGMTRNKEAGQAEALYEMTQWSDLVPPISQAAAGRLPIPATVFNTVSTNVPGPQIPLFQAGRRCLSWLPMGVVTSGIGLFTSILTYDKRITLGMTVDSAQIPDPWFLSECIRDAYVELRELAGVEAIEFDSFPLSETTHPNSAQRAEVPVTEPARKVTSAKVEPQSPLAQKSNAKESKAKKATSKAKVQRAASKKAVPKRGKSKKAAPQEGSPQEGSLKEGDVQEGDEEDRHE